MFSQLWPTVEISKINSLWFRSLQPVREEVSLTKLEEMLEQERRCYIEKSTNLPFPGKTEIDNPDDDEDGDEAEEESEGGEADDEMDVQQGSASPATTTAAAVTQHQA